jgi:hypothetical protein
MTPADSTSSPLARLVLFIICLSIAGSAVAGVHYYAVDLPVQMEQQPPHNAAWTKCENCRLTCSYAPDPVSCLNDCDLYC